MDQLLDELAHLGVPRIAFSGGGEPLFWKAGDIGAALVRASGFAQVSLTSSGDQLWDPATGSLAPVAAQVMRACSVLCMNIPAVDDASFGRLVRGGDSSWSRTRDIIQALSSRRKTEPGWKYEVRAVVVVTRMNMAHLAHIDRTLLALGVNGISYKSFKAFEPRSVTRLSVRADAILDEYAGTSVFSGDLTDFLAGLSSPPRLHARCWANRLGYDAIIDPDGQIFICTPTVGRPEHAIGNFRDGFSGVWGGAERVRTLRSLDARSVAGACPAECRHHRENRATEDAVAAKPG